MDENDFLKAFAGIDILHAEAVANAIGRVIAKLREGMIEGGMEPMPADFLISEAFRIFLTVTYGFFNNQGSQQ